MESWMAIPALLVVHFGLSRLTKSDTSLGRRLRASEHDAWAMAVERKRRELDELMGAEPGGDS